MIQGPAQKAADRMAREKLMAQEKKTQIGGAAHVDDLAQAFGGKVEELGPPNYERAEEFVYNLRVPLKVKKLPHYQALPDLNTATAGSVGIDLYAAVDAPVCLNTIGSFETIPAGIAIELPVGFEAQIRPRSGLAAKHGVTVLNAPGTIDSDYRGEIKVVLVNMSTHKFWVHRGDRIAQMIVAGPVPIPVIEYVEELSDTDRGDGGFGSTGK